MLAPGAERNHLVALYMASRRQRKTKRIVHPVVDYPAAGAIHRKG
jgi:hypothetical protein